MSDMQTELSLWCSNQPRPDDLERRPNPKHRIVVDAAEPIAWEEHPCPVSSCDGVIRRCSAPPIDLTKQPSVRARRL